MGRKKVSEIPTTTLQKIKKDKGVVVDRLFDNKNPVLSNVELFNKGLELQEQSKMPLSKLSYGAMKEIVSQYFNHCGLNKINPSIPSLCLWLGVSRQTIERWRVGTISTEFQEIIQQAYNIIQTIKDDLAERGEIVGLVHIFHSKNYFNMKDKNISVDIAYNPAEEAKANKEIIDALPDEQGVYVTDKKRGSKK